MKNFLFGCTMALASLTMGSAYADPYCCPSPCETSCCAGDFNGFYVGGTIGVYSNTVHINDYDGFYNAGGTSTNSTDFTAGILLGYDWECSNKLLGIVADWNWVANDHRDSGLGTVAGTVVNRNHSYDWFTTIRGRAGVTICDALVYVTLGAAVRGFEVRGDNFNHDHTHWGWAGGVGAEYLLGCNWSLGAELLFLNFSQHNRSFTADVQTTRRTFRIGASDNSFAGRIILNYRFGNCWCF